MATTASAARTALDTKPNWPRDPLHYFDEFPLRANHFANGVPLEISTNSQAVIDAARKSWGPFPKLLDADPIHVRIGVSDSDRADLSPNPSILGQRGLISIIGDAENFGICDVASGFSFGWVTPATVADQSFFRYHFMDLMAGLLYTPPNFGVDLFGLSFDGASGTQYNLYLDNGAPYANHQLAPVGLASVDQLQQSIRRWTAGTSFGGE